MELMKMDEVVEGVKKPSEWMKCEQFQIGAVKVQHVKKVSNTGDIDVISLSKWNNKLNKFETVHFGGNCLKGVINSLIQMQPSVKQSELKTNEL
jgi:hypothetical protein